MEPTFDHDSYHPFEVLNQPQGQPITDPDLRESILAQITQRNDEYEAKLSPEQRAEQRGESFFGGASVATPEQAAAIQEAAKNATPEELAKYTVQQLPGATPEASIDSTGQPPVPAPVVESHEDALKRTGAATNDADGSASTVESVAKRMAAAEKPTSLEESLANVRLSTERQQRIVISGDPHVRRKFYEILAERNQVFYQGGTPIITASDKDIPKLLEQAAKEVPGASVVHALNMEMNRNTPGVWGGIKDKLSNTFGMKHEITVFAVGDQKQIAEKLEEVNKFVHLLQDKNVIPAGDAPRGDSLMPPEKTDPKDKVATQAAADAVHKPIELKNLGGLRDVLQYPLDKVAYYNAERQEKAMARREFRDEKDTKAMEDARAKEKEAAEGGGGTTPVKVHQRTETLAADLDKQFIKPELLRTDTGTQQSHAQKMMYGAASLADPAQNELSTLPDSSRQKFIAQMAAVIEKVADKEVDHIHKKGRPLPSAEVDLGRKGGTAPSPRERLTDFIKMELARDETFAQKMPELLKGMVDSKALTEEQATRITERVAELSREMPAKDKPEAAQDTPADTKVSPAPVVEPAEKASSTTTNESTEKAPTESSAQSKEADQPKLDASTPAAAEKTSVTSEPAATASTPEGAEKVSAVVPVESTERASASSPEKTPEAAAPVAGLEGKLADLVSQDPANVSPDKAMSVIAELDAKQSLPLSALGVGEGAAATKSLARMEGFLEKAEAGAFGPEASAYAGNLKESLDRWKDQDLGNAMAAGTSPAAHADQVDALKAADPKWHDQAGASPAPSMKPELPTVAPVEQGPVMPPVDPVKEAERLEAGVRLAKTEVAAGMLAGMLDNPAGKLTHRDKSWNEGAVGQMVDKVFALDSESMSKLSPGAREGAVHAAVWLATHARDGKLPGFDSPEGQAKVQQLVEKAAGLTEHLDNILVTSPAVVKQIEKADGVIDRMAAREKEFQLSAVMGRDPQATRDQSSLSGTDQTRATHEMAKDLVHIVYRGGTASPQQVRGLLKSAGKLTPQTLKGLDPATKAQAALALKTLVSEVRQGGPLGDFAKLSPAEKKIVAGAQEASDKLSSALSKDKSMAVEMIKAHTELNGSAAEKPAKSMEKDSSQAPDVAARSGRSSGSTMER